MSVQGVALVADPGVLPGRLREVALPDARVVSGGLALPGLTVVDVRAGCTSPVTGRPAHGVTALPAGRPRTRRRTAPSAWSTSPGS